MRQLSIRLLKDRVWQFVIWKIASLILVAEWVWYHYTVDVWYYGTILWYDTTYGNTIQLMLLGTGSVGKKLTKFLEILNKYRLIIKVTADNSAEKLIFWIYKAGTKSS